MTQLSRTRLSEKQRKEEGEIDGVAFQKIDKKNIISSERKDGKIRVRADGQEEGGWGAVRHSGY